MGNKNIEKYWFETKLSEDTEKSLAFDQQLQLQQA